MHTKEEKMQAFGRFLDVLDALRANCPWDKKQTNESLRPNTIEETYELCDALIKNDIPDICKELGDVLLHICFYAKIAEEQAQFDMADVCNALTRKMITRHPHVYHPSQIEATKTAGPVFGTFSSPSNRSTKHVWRRIVMMSLNISYGKQISRTVHTMRTAARQLKTISSVFKGENLQDCWQKT